MELADRILFFPLCIYIMSLFSWKKITSVPEAVCKKRSICFSWSPFIFLSCNSIKLLCSLTAYCCRRSSISLNWHVWLTCVLRQPRKQKLWFPGKHLHIVQRLLSLPCDLRPAMPWYPLFSPTPLLEQHLVLVFLPLPTDLTATHFVHVPNALLRAFTGSSVNLLNLGS